MATATATMDTKFSDEALKAHDHVHRWMWWSMGMGLVPVPLLDLAGVAAMQVKMVNDISREYEVPFDKTRAKRYTSALLGSLLSTSAALGPVGHLVKGIPGVGHILGAFTLPVCYGAATYAIGRTFTHHFEGGGDFLTFDLDRARAEAKEEYEEGKAKAKAKAASKS